jgi:two-component system NtrC family sensor kinase
MAMPWLGNALYLARLWPMAGVDATPLAFTLTGAIYAVGVFGLGLFDLVPVARHRLIDSMPDGVLVLDLDNRIVDINPAARRMLGVTGAGAVGEPAGSLLAAWPDLVDRYRDVRDEHTELRLEGRGGPHYLDLRITPLRDARGRFQGRLIVFSDVTARKRTEEALQQNEKLASLGQLLAGVAHELNNPLSVIVGHATLLLRGNLHGDGPAARVEKIAAAAERCGRIVRNFLAIARQRTTERTAGDLNRILRDAVDFLAYQLELDEVEVTLDLAENLPPVWADAHQIQQVALNLITNAQHAMRAHTGGRRLTLASWLERDRGRLGFSVADTGPGVPETLQHRIFEPFFTTKPVGMGSGLGLSVCRGIVAAHQGEIDVRPVPGGGAVFVVELPLSDGVPDGGPQAPAAAEPVAGRRILVVDDEQMVAELLAEILAEDGHQVEIATSGADALARLQDHRVDAVVSDVKMPGLDGPALYERLCLHDASLRGRFVFITGDTLSPDTRKFLEDSGVPTLSKPFDGDVVRSVVRDALRADPPPVY